MNEITTAAVVEVEPLDAEAIHFPVAFFNQALAFTA
jgi:hypothetical protein